MKANLMGKYLALGVRFNRRSQMVTTPVGQQCNIAVTLRLIAADGNRL
jgi:hypothetical protein